MAKHYYEMEVRHHGLNKFRHIRGADPHVVRAKAAAQKAAWEEQWGRKCEVQEAREARAQAKYEKDQAKEEGLQEAAERTQEAQDAMLAVRTLLQHTLGVDDVIDWNDLKSSDGYSEPVPKPKSVKEPELLAIPVEPKEVDAKYRPQIRWWEYIFPSRMEERKKQANQLFNDDRQVWERQCEACEADNAKRKASHARRLENAKVEHEKEVAEWRGRRAEFDERQRQQNAAIDAQHKKYLTCEEGAVEDYCDMVLSNSEYPEIVPKDWDIDYSVATKMLIVNYSLPTPEDMPSLKEVKYQVSKQEFKETYLSEKERSALFDEAIYQICLRTTHELLEADVANAINVVVFNGFVTATDKRIGHVATSCIISLQADKAEFMAINLVAIKPKLCFKALKGVGASALYSISAIPPIVNMSKEDRRFIESYDVANGLNEGVNIAMMDWEDFEHLVRELFEKEFKSAGGEVKVTQASRDGGVDAVAFDPDPIRGGKIVIQAKRYTNTVGVSAVRDLYGTVLNEGASKGILVTTSDFGPDAYAFAKDKPLTLLNGANLLHLLERHGHKARIDLKEAKAAKVK